MRVALVAAVAENGVIGADGELPWHYPEDLQHFKETTVDHPVIMGRRTFESIDARLGGPLPRRTNIVLSTRELDLPDGAVLADSVEAALDAARDDLAMRHGADTVYVVGGASVYEQFLPEADSLVITEVPESPAGDTHFPDVGNEWREVSREERGELSFVRYERADR